MEEQNQFETKFLFDENETSLSTIENLSEVNADVRNESEEDTIDEYPSNGSNNIMSTSDIAVGLGSLAIAEIHQNRVDSNAEYMDEEWLEEHSFSE